MPKYVRWREAGATYFFTVCTYGRRSILTSDRGRTFLHDAFALVRAKRPFTTLASVLLPDHLHVIWTLPRGDDDFPIRWAQIKERFTRLWLAAGGPEKRATTAQRRARQRGVWQPRYWEHRLRDDRDYIQHRDYIHFNPVKHGYVRSPEEWKWSSVHAHLARGELGPDWWSDVRLQLPELWE
jgi:putative transposase